MVQFVDPTVPHVAEKIGELVQAIPMERISERAEEQIVDRTVPHVAAKILEVVKAIPTERSSEGIVEQRFDLLVPQVAQCAPQRRKKKNRKKPEILVSVSDTDQNNFVAVLVDSDVHFASDSMWDAIDSVVCGGDSILPQQQVQVAHILDRFFFFA